MAEEQKNEQPKVEASNVSSDSKLLAAVSYLWICSVIIYLVKKDDEYVKFHAKQGVVIFAISVIGFFIGLFTFGIGSMIIGLVTFVMVVVAFENHGSAPVGANPC